MDGLRTIAVLAVILFHLQLESFAGGFLGVDIFFVISGFLMTGVIGKQAANGTFDYLSFLARRIRRLYPALTATILLTTIACAFVLNATHFREFAASALSAVFWSSNVLFYFQAGYWDTMSDFKPLLHTWSLGVEEQFYFVFPFFLLLIRNVVRSRVLTFVALAFAFLIVALVINYFDPSVAFFLLPARFFQFLIGSAVYAWLQQAERSGKTYSAGLTNTMQILGLIACLVGIVVLQGGGLYNPVLESLIPTLGIVPVLLFSSRITTSRPLVSQWLSFPPIVWLGKISYSLYLAHWPIIVLYRYKFGLHLSWAEQTILFVATLIAGAALFYGVERVFYSKTGGKTSNLKMTFGFVGAAAALIVVGNVAILQAGGFPQRFPKTVLTEEYLLAAEMKRHELSEDGCFLRDLNNPVCNWQASNQVMFFGNSTEPDGVNMFHDALKDMGNVNFIRLGNMIECQNFSWDGQKYSTTNPGCLQKLNTLQDPELYDRLDMVIVTVLGNYHLGMEHYLIALENLRKARPDLPIIVIET